MCKLEGERRQVSIKKSTLSTTLLVIFLISTFSALRVSAALATVAIDPPATNVPVNSSFSVNINVSNISNFTCWQLKLYYVKSVLNCTAADEGPFLSSVSSTYFDSTITNNYNSTHGCVQAYCTIFNVNSANGSGVIAIVTFKAVGAGNSPLRLAEIKLGDEKVPPQDIPYSVSDGTVHVSSVSGTHDIAVTGCTCCKTIVAYGYATNISATVENLGDFTETFNVTLYGNLREIATVRNVVLTSGMSTVVIFTWNTLSFSKGDYVMKTSATPVPNETDTTNNNYTHGPVLLTIPGDVTGDVWVDMLDISIIIEWFMTSSPTYNPNCDINGDLTIDMADISIAIDNFMVPDP